MNLEAYRAYIALAELAWFRVFDAGKRTNQTMPDGAPLYRLPPRLDTRQKIYAYFRRWWGPRLASNMLCNLPLFERNGQLLMIGYDWPPVSMTPREVELLRRNGDQTSLRAVLCGGLPEECITYLLVRNRVSQRQMIVQRSDAISDFRYQDCPRAEE